MALIMTIGMRIIYCESFIGLANEFEAKLINLKVQSKQKKLSIKKSQKSFLLLSIEM